MPSKIEIQYTDCYIIIWDMPYCRRLQLTVVKSGSQDNKNCCQQKLNEWRKINCNSPQLWQHTLTEELQLDPSQHPMLLTEVPLNPVSNREMMSEIMFEKFQVNEEYPHELLTITSSVVDRKM